MKKLNDTYLFTYNNIASRTGRAKIDTGATNSTSTNAITDTDSETGNVNRI